MQRLLKSAKDLRKVPGSSDAEGRLALFLFKCGTCSADGKLSSEQKAMLRDDVALG